MALHLKIIEDWSEFLALEDKWDALADSVELPLPFLMHAWSRAWCEGYGAKEHLYVLTAWRGGELVGVLPLVRVRRQVLKFIPVEAFTSMTSCSVASSNVICRRANLNVVVNAFRQRLLKESDWGIIDLQYVSSDSETLPLLLQKFNLRNKLFAQTKPWNGSYYVDTHGSFESYYDGLGKTFRRTRKCQDNRLAKLGEVEFELESEFNERTLERFYDMEDTGWKHTRGQPLRRYTQALTFFNEMSKSFAGKKRYLMAHIKVGGEVAASALCVLAPKSMHYLKIAVDYNNKELARLAPGQALLGYLIRFCFENKLERFDFYGMYAEYEAHWSRKTDQKHHLLIYNRLNFWVNLHLALREAFLLVKALRKLKLVPRLAPSSSTV